MSSKTLLNIVSSNQHKDASSGITRPNAIEDPVLEAGKPSSINGFDVSGNVPVVTEQDFFSREEVVSTQTEVVHQAIKSGSKASPSATNLEEIYVRSDQHMQAQATTANTHRLAVRVEQAFSSPGTWSIEKEIHVGQKSTIYDVRRHPTAGGGRFALKQGAAHILEGECNLLTRLCRIYPRQFPHVFGRGCHGTDQYLVMQLLGPSVFEVWNTFRRTMSTKTVLRISFQVLNRLEILHYNGYVHQDVRPGHFLFRNGEMDKIFLIDFSSVYNYRTGTGVQVDSSVGMDLYKSSAAHYSLTPSPVDDVESLGYVIVQLLTGSLPWERKGTNETRVMKAAFNSRRMESAPAFQLYGYFNHVKQVREVIQKRGCHILPDYVFLRETLHNILQ